MASVNLDIPRLSNRAFETLAQALIAHRIHWPQPRDGGRTPEAWRQELDTACRELLHALFASQTHPTREPAIASFETATGSRLQLIDGGKA